MIERTYWETFVHILCDSMRPVRFISLWVYILVAGSFCHAGYNTKYSDELQVLFNAFPWWVWACLSTYVAIARFIGLFVWEGKWYTRRITPVIGMVVWAFLFTGAGILTPIDGMALLYFIPMGMEVWILGRAFAEGFIGND
jgi:hypothetical protein